MLGRSESGGGELDPGHKQSWNVYYYETNTFMDRDAERQTIGFRTECLSSTSENVRDTKKEGCSTASKARSPERIVGGPR